ncbi:hypothetical protein [Desmospora profundinema]|uniref:Aspartokinase n=1 Tax=Desmospora profundinema TaxID=1571184 RepID=A0ABU1IM20_9BACL|nr:hypothetical protein [Desmospora profundinema]MDR6225821.1 aspartokinase [Desmospora profundinema]
MLFHDRMVIIHQSYGTPRVIYSLRNCLERNHIESQLHVKRQKPITTYQLLVPRRDANKALDLLKRYKRELEEA